MPLRMAVVAPLQMTPQTAGLTAASRQTLQLTLGGGAKPVVLTLKGAGTLTQNGLYTVGAVVGDVEIEATDAAGSKRKTTVRVRDALTNGVINALAADATGVYAGGDFTRFRGEPVGHIVRIDPRTGERDAAFATGSGFNGPVHQLIVQGAHVHIGGAFTSYRNTEAVYLARVKRETGALEPLADPLTACNDCAVLALAADGDSLFVGSTQGVQKRGADGARVFSVDLPPVHALAVANDGVIIGGELAGNIAKISRDTGAMIAAFTSGKKSGGSASAAPGANGTVRSIVIKDSVYAAGDFTSYRSERADRIVKLSLVDGVRDAVFSSSGFNDRVLSLFVTDSVFAVGAFTSYRDSPHERVAKLDMLTGAAATDFGAARGFNGTGHVAAGGAGALVMGGAFCIGGEPSGALVFSKTPRSRACSCRSYAAPRLTPPLPCLDAS